MAPMDKYTRLVGGAVHGLSCFHTQCFFLSLSSLGTKEVAFKKMFAKVSCFDQSLGGV